MHRLVVSTVISLAWLTVASSQLSCRSQLRLVLPQLFTHCACSYAEWSEWEPVNVTLVPTSQCPSGEAVAEVRTQRVLGISSICVGRKEERVVCAPEVVERLILALGLGSSGQHISVEGRPPFEKPGIIHPAPDIGVNETLSRKSRSNCDSGQICHHVTSPHRGRRSERKLSYISRNHRSTQEPVPLGNDPLPFNFLQHGMRYKRPATNCQPDGMQHILFMLDTSGSIGEVEFNRMTATLGGLVTLFCKPIKIAVMTFNHDYYIEFCFDCFDNTCLGRLDAGIAMSSINYRHGWTHTAGAATCACDFLLTSTCGLDPTANCIDVVFITDGHSNDPSHDVCTEVQCLHNRFGVNTYAIGITDSTNPAELDCITNNSIQPGKFHLFNFDTFDEFNEVLDEIIVVLANPDPNAVYTCVDPQDRVGTESCTF